MKKVLFFLIAFSFFACSKDDAKVEPVTILDYGWVDGHEEIIPDEFVNFPEEDTIVGWEFEAYAVLKNNSNDTVKGQFYFVDEFEVDGKNEKFVISIPNSYDPIILLPNKTKRFSTKIWQYGSGTYDTGYDYVEFIIK